VGREVRVGGGGGGRGRSVGEETFDVVAWDDLHESARFDVPDFDEGRLEGEDVGVV
jgi:hypothetical protein